MIFQRMSKLLFFKFQHLVQDGIAYTSQNCKPILSLSGHAWSYYILLASLQLPTLQEDGVCHVIRGKMEQFEHNSSSYPRQHHLQPTGLKTFPVTRFRTNNLLLSSTHEKLIIYPEH